MMKNKLIGWCDHSTISQKLWNLVSVVCVNPVSTGADRIYVKGYFGLMRFLFLVQFTVFASCLVMVLVEIVRPCPQNAPQDYLRY